MKHRNRLLVTALASLAALGAATSGTAQTTKAAPGKTPEHKEGMKGMKGMQDKPGMPGKQSMQGMNGMMGGPHHVLAMAYRDNLVTFAKALRGQVSQAKTVNTDIARPAVAEMKRSLEQMTQHHHAHMATMSGHADSSMSVKMKHMETHLAALGEHLTALESDVAASTPDAKRVSMHTAEILKACAGMSSMHAKDSAKHMR